MWGRQLLGPKKQENESCKLTKRDKESVGKWLCGLEDKGRGAQCISKESIFFEWKPMPLKTSCERPLWIVKD